MDARIKNKCANLECNNHVEVKYTKKGILSKSQKIYCSVACKNKSKNSKPNHFGLCPECNRFFSRHKKKTRDQGVFCSRKCVFDRKARISIEIKAIRNIKANIRKWIKLLIKQKATVKPKVKDIKEKECAHCGAFFIPKPYQIYCSDNCKQKHCKAIKEAYRRTDRYKSNRRAGRKKYKATRRAREKIEAQNIDPLEVFERDKWCCYICSKRTPKDKRGTYDDNAPELDHIIPLSKGGSHTWGNVACSCRQCNITKSNKLLGQMHFTSLTVLQIKVGA